MVVGIWILGDRLNKLQSSLQSCQQEKAITPVIFIESSNYIKQRPYHRQKLVLVWSAMRHFAAELEDDGWQVNYHIVTDFIEPLQQWIEDNKVTELRITRPCDRPFQEYIKGLNLSCKIVFYPDNHFLWSREEFQTWAQSRKRLLLEDFYRAGRKKYDILMSEKEPVGGKWNYDKQNRKPPKKGLNPPQRLWFEPDSITQEVITRVEENNFSVYGNLTNFRWGVTRQQALQVLNHFLTECLPNFGTYQDAMLIGEYQGHFILKSEAICLRLN